MEGKGRGVKRTEKVEKQQRKLGDGEKTGVKAKKKDKRRGNQKEAE